MSLVGSRIGGTHHGLYRCKATRRGGRGAEPSSSARGEKKGNWGDIAARSGGGTSQHGCDAHLPRGARVQHAGQKLLSESWICRDWCAAEVLPGAGRGSPPDGEETHRLGLKSQWFPLDVDNQSGI